LLRSNVEVVSPDTLVVAEEFGDWEDSRRRIDLLGIDSDANLVVIELKPAERLWQAILKRAFEGRLVPQDPADEPAEALLARIRSPRARQGQIRFDS
jgi:hypothetical protein